MSSSKQNIVATVVVALLVSLGVYLAGGALASGGGSVGGGGPVKNVPDFYTNGVGIGQDVFFSKTVSIPAGKNQAAWCNTGPNGFGKTVLVDNAEFGFSSGTASSSDLLYVATSTSATIANDYARPTGDYLLIDGASFATSTPGSRFYVSTSTSAGRGLVAVPVGSCVNFQVQEKYACKSVGACETATSTNRGISTFTGILQGHFTP